MDLAFFLTMLQAALDVDYHHSMPVPHQTMNPREAIVGWYLFNHLYFIFLILAQALL